MRKTLIVVTVIFLALVAIASYRNTGFWDDKALSYSNLKRERYNPPKKQNVTLVIQYSNDRMETYQAQSDVGDTAFNLLRTTAFLEEFDMYAGEDKLNPVLESIGGYENNDEYEWIYTLNDKDATEDPDNQIIADGDVVKFIYVRK